jgi:hypothetical protein
MTYIILTRNNNNNNNFHCSIPYVARAIVMYSHVVELLFRPDRFYVLLLEMEPYLFLILYHKTASCCIGKKLVSIYQLLTDAPMHVDPIWHTLPLLRRCSAEKTVRYHPVSLSYGLRRKGARTLPSAYRRTPLGAGWGSP